MERLTKKNDSGGHYYPKCFEKCNGLGASGECDDCEIMTSVCEKLGDYEDLDEQGRIIKLPCKVGDTVLYISEKIILEYEVVGFSVDKTGVRLIYGEHHVNGNDETYSCNLAVDRIGKTVFLTKSEAESKLTEWLQSEAE